MGNGIPAKDNSAANALFITILIALILWLLFMSPIKINIRTSRCPPHQIISSSCGNCGKKVMYCSMCLVVFGGKCICENPKIKQPSN